MTDMIFDDNDLFAYAAKQHEQKQSTVRVKRSNKALSLPAALIRESLELDPASPSHLRWKIRPRHQFATERSWKYFNTQFANTPAGTVLKDGNTAYYRMRLGGVYYLAHRIVWLLFYGTDPANMMIDHQDGCGTNNTPENLRLATKSENGRNSSKRSDNTSGVTGVIWNKRLQKWHVQISIHGQRIHLGFFSNKHEAVAARKNAEVKYFGEFSHDASRKAAHITEHP